MFFVQDWRERIKEENPGVTFGEVGKLLGAKWKSMSAAEKKVCHCWWKGCAALTSALRGQG